MLKKEFLQIIPHNQNLQFRPNLELIYLKSNIVCHIFGILTNQLSIPTIKTVIENFNQF